MEIRPAGYEVIDGRGLSDEAVVIDGFLPLDPNGEITQVGYDVAIVVPPRYPRHIPDMYCVDESLPRDIDRHIFANGRACLCVRSEIRQHLPSGYGAVDFIDCLVHPFLVGQFYYESHGTWPWPDRSHGTDGILEAYKEVTGFSELSIVRGFAEILSKKKPVKGHWPCPCGSGRKLRHCHRDFYLEIRQSIYYEDAAYDLQFLTTR